MSRSTGGVLLEGIHLKTASKTPLHRQIYYQVRELVMSGHLVKATLFPSSRTLAKSLGVSRFTVVTALDQLISEGYLSGKQGSGAYVEGLINTGESTKSVTSKTEQKPANDLSQLMLLSKKATQMNWRPSLVTNKDQQKLQMSAPDYRLFPTQLWSRLTKLALAGLNSELAHYKINDTATLLQQQIASQVALSRGIECEPSEVVITFGAHHGISLLVELLADPGDNVAFEEPGMAAVRSVFSSAGCHLIPLPVDDQGANPCQLETDEIKLAFVTAAKQQPLIIPMSIKRKLELLKWASKTQALIIEDDQGSEFRYQGQPIPPLKALDRQNRVIYINSFSMSLLQSLRVGYIIMPKQLAIYCRQLIQVRYRSMPLITEQVLALMIQQGEYNRHVHKVRRAYAIRQKSLVSILQNDFKDFLEAPIFGAGFHLLCYFKDQSIDESAFVIECDRQGLGVEQLSYYFAATKPARKGLLLGFAASTIEEIAEGAATLLQIFCQGVGLSK